MEPIRIDHDSGVPPFEQLRTQVAAAVARGDLAAGTRLGTVRQTASDLGLAVNTVARAYRELEADGVVVTRGRQGTFVRSAVVDGAPERGHEVRQACAQYVAVARRAGLTREEALRLVTDAWD